MPQQRDPQRHHDDRAEEQREPHGAEAGKGHAQPETDRAQASALPVFKAGPITAALRHIHTSAPPGLPFNTVYTGGEKV